jgi:hypothetical protein
MGPKLPQKNRNSMKSALMVADEEICSVLSKRGYAVNSTKVCHGHIHTGG